MTIETLIQNVNILLPNCEGWETCSSVLIKDKLIRAINPDESTLSPDVNKVEGKGQYLIPGLIEMHGHFYGFANTEMRSQLNGYCPLFLAGGVTTVRTPGEFEPEVTYQWKQSIEQGEKIGPRIVSGGWYFDKSPGIVRWFEPSESIEDMRACFDKRDNVSDFFKVYSSMPTEWIREVCCLGHEKGKKIYGHLGMSSTIGAIKAGLDGIEHGFYTIQEFYKKPSPTFDTNALEELDMDSEIVKRVQDVIVSHQTAVTPTSITFMLAGSKYTDWLNSLDAWQFLDSESQKIQIERRKEWDSDLAAVEKQERLMDKQRKFVGGLFRQGARIFCGTDPVYPLMLPGKALVWEAANLVDCGMPTTAVLRSLTIEAARELSLETVIGSIAVGKQADIVLLEKNPIEDIQNLASTQLIWKSGRMHTPEDLQQSAIGKIS